MSDLGTKLQSDGEPLAGNYLCMAIVKNLKQNPAVHEKIAFYPKSVTELTEQYDGILVTANRCRLQSILPLLSERQHLTKYFAFMQNN